MGFDNVNVNVSGPVQPTSTYKTKVLKGNHSFASQVTEPNMKYVIKYDFDLGGAEITIPENCVLQFDGGSVSNGVLILNKTRIITDGLGRPWDNTVKLIGDFDNSPKRDYSTGELGIPYSNSKINRRVTANSFFYTLTYHRRDTDNNNGAKDLLLYISEDGFSFYNAYKINLCDTPNGKTPSDFSFVFHNGVYYIIADYVDPSKPYYNATLGANNCICLYKSTDLLNFTCVEIEIPDELRPNFRQAWAPDIFVYNNELYLTVTSTDGANIFTVPNTSTQRWVHNIAYICKIDVEHNTISGYTTFVLPDNSTTEIPYTNWIDGHVFEYNNSWYLIIKDENQRCCYLYGILDFANSMDTISPSNPIALSSEPIHKFNFVGEGPSVAIKGAQLYFYFDLYTNSTSYQDLLGKDNVAVVISNNLESFSNSAVLKIEEDCWNRHSTYKYCPTSEKPERGIITNAIFLNGNSNNITYADTFENVRLVNKLQEDIFLPTPNTSYFLWGNDTPVIDNIDTRFFKNGDRLLISFNTNNDNASLTIDATGNHKFYPKTMFFDGSLYKEAIIEFIYNGEIFRTGRIQQVPPSEKQELYDVLKNVTTSWVSSTNTYYFYKSYDLLNYTVRANDCVYAGAMSTTYAKAIYIRLDFLDSNNNVVISKAFTGVCTMLYRSEIPEGAVKMNLYVRSGSYSSTDTVTFDSIIISQKFTKEIFFHYMRGVAFGDSITSGVANNDNTSWLTFINAVYQNNYMINKAVGGASWVPQQGQSNILSELRAYSTDYLKRSLVFLSGGYNDVNANATIGDVSNTFDYATLNTSTYTDTIIGAIECAFAYIYNNLKNAARYEVNHIQPKIIYILTYPKSDVPNWWVCREKIKTACSKWGVLCIDIAEIVGLVTVDGGVGKPAYLFCDVIHPSEYANRLICDYVVNKVFESSI